MTEPQMTPEQADTYDSEPELNIYPSYGRAVIECRSKRAEQFMEAFCARNPGHGFEDEPETISGVRRFIDDGNDDRSDFINEAEKEFLLSIGYPASA